MNVIGVNALCASLNVEDLLDTAIHIPLIRKEYAIITTKANIRLIAGSIRLEFSYISNIFSEINNAIIVNTKLRIPVIIEDIETLKNFPIIMSLLFIGKVSSVSNVPLSFSPAVASVAGYVADIVIAIIINRKAYTVT